MSLETEDTKRIVDANENRKVIYVFLTTMYAKELTKPFILELATKKDYFLGLAEDPETEGTELADGFIGARNVRLEHKAGEPGQYLSGVSGRVRRAVPRSTPDTPSPFRIRIHEHGPSDHAETQRRRYDYVQNHGFSESQRVHRTRRPYRTRTPVHGEPLRENHRSDESQQERRRQKIPQSTKRLPQRTLRSGSP